MSTELNANTQAAATLRMLIAWRFGEAGTKGWLKFKEGT